jgi:hypothetical protein
LLLLTIILFITHVEYLELDPVWKASIWFASGALLLIAWFYLRRLSPWSKSQASVKENVAVPDLLIGSPMDEAWQILHHMRIIENPLAVKSNVFTYLFSSWRTSIAQSVEIERIHGAISYGDLNKNAKFWLGLLFVWLLMPLWQPVLTSLTKLTTPPWAPLSVVIAVLVAGLLALLLFTGYYGREFYSAFLTPFRWVGRRLDSTVDAFSEIATYVVRRRGWSVLQSMAMGLEGFRYEFPRVYQTPTLATKSVGKYEDIPAGALQRALEMRSAWIDRYFGDLTKLFSQMVVTASDLSSLLHTVENDPSLVHAAYYTDEECIERIAGWIAGKETATGDAKLLGAAITEYGTAASHSVLGH